MMASIFARGWQGALFAVFTLPLVHPECSRSLELPQGGGIVSFCKI